jgi:RHS repeat-associated protein
MIAKGSKKNDKTKDKTHWKKNNKNKKDKKRWKKNKKKRKKHTSEQIYHFHNDHLGTPQKLTNATGSVVWATDYLPFGQVTITAEAVENNLRFAGQYYDTETGLHYNYHRYYDPVVGRYLTPDPIGIEDGINLYAYVQNNPVNYTDPYGLESIGGYMVGNDNAGLFNYKAHTTNNSIIGTFKSGIEGSVIYAGIDGRNGIFSGGADGYHWRGKVEGGISNYTNISSSLKVTSFEGEVYGQLDLFGYYLKGSLNGSAGSLGYDAMLGKNGVKLSIHVILGAGIGLEWGSLNNNSDCK